MQGSTLGLMMAALAALLLLAGSDLNDPDHYSSGDSSDLPVISRDQFNTIDNNHDGYISHNEAKAMPRLYALWRQADLNQDGRISPTEFEQFEANGGTSDNDTPSMPGLPGKP